MHRYEVLAQKLGKTINKIAVSSDIDASTLRKAIERDSKVTADNALKICKAFPQVNYDWLVSGEGEILNTDTPAVPNEDEIDRSFKQILTELIFGRNLKGINDKDTELINELKSLHEKIKTRQQERKEDSK